MVLIVSSSKETLLTKINLIAKTTFVSDSTDRSHLTIMTGHIMRYNTFLFFLFFNFFFISALNFNFFHQPLFIFRYLNFLFFNFLFYIFLLFKFFLQVNNSRITFKDLILNILFLNINLWLFYFAFDVYSHIFIRLEYYMIPILINIIERKVSEFREIFVNVGLEQLESEGLLAVK